MSSRENEWADRVHEVLDMARHDRGDWLAAIEFVAEDLSSAGFADESERLHETLEVVRQGGSADWLAMIESVAEDLS